MTVGSAASVGSVKGASADILDLEKVGIGNLRFEIEKLNLRCNCSSWFQRETNWALGIENWSLLNRKTTFFLSHQFFNGQISMPNVDGPIRYSET